MAPQHLTDPEDIAASTFGTSFRGYDPAEVRSYLASVAKRLANALERIDVLESEARELESQAGEPVEIAPDPADLTRWLGAETARVLDAANEAADSQRARAVEEADQLVSDAKARADAIIEEAERNRSAVLEAATSEADSIMTEAEVLRESVQEHYDAELGRAAEEAERTIAEASAVREVMLVELADKRHEIRDQIEQLKAGRDALMGVLANATAVVGSVFDDLEDAMPNARRVAEVAANRVAHSPITVAEYDRYVLEVGSEESPSEDPALPVEPLDLAGVTDSVAVGELDEEFGPVDAAAGDEDDEPSADIVTLYDQSRYEADDQDEADETETTDSVESGEPRLTVVAALDEDDEGPLDVLFERLRDDRADQQVSAEETQDDADQDDADQDDADQDDAETPEPDDTGAPADADSDEEADSDGEDATDEASSEGANDDGPSPRDQLIAELTRALKNELSDEQNDLLDGLRQGDSAGLDYPGPEAQTERYRAVAADFAEPQADSIAEAIVSQLQRRVPAVLAETAADVEEMSERVRSIYREVRTHRIDEAVRSALSGQPA